MSKPEIYIDGMNTFLRHFSANPSISLNNEECGGIVGFLKNIQNLTEKFNPSSIVVVWEGGGSSKRRGISKSYKNNRRPVKLNRNNEFIPGSIENRDDQLSTLIDLLGKTLVRQVYVEDCEADDVIAYLCYNNKNKHKIIVSSDKDYYQLIDENTSVWSTNQKKSIDTEYVISKFGVHPNNFTLARSMVGDQSDGIKGVSGVGFATLRKVFPELKECNLLYIDDIIKKSNDLISQGNKLKAVKAISESKDTIKKTYSLSILVNGLLSHDQIKAINFQVESERSNDKFGFIKVLNKKGLNIFDPHKFFIVTKSSLENK